MVTIGQTAPPMLKLVHESHDVFFFLCFFSRRCCFRFLPRDSPAGARVSRGRSNLRGAWPRGAADEELQHGESHVVRTDPVPWHQTPPAVQTQSPPRDDPPHRQVIPPPLGRTDDRPRTPPCRLKTKRTSAMPAAGWRDLGGVDPAWSSRNAGMC